MIRRIFLSSILMTFVIVPLPAHALVGTDARPYFEWCATTADLDCFESITFKFADQTFTYVQPGEIFGNIEAKKTNIGYIWSPPGFVGADGGNQLRLEASYLNRNLSLIVGGTKVKLMDPLPAACRTDPSLPCGLVGQLPSVLWVSVTLRTSNQRFTPGVATANMFDPSVKLML